MKKKVIYLTVLLVLLAAIFVAGSAWAARSVQTQDAAVWELTKTRVVDPGKVVPLDEGDFIQGVILEARAKAKGVNSVPEGTFLLTLDLFSPVRDMPGQKAGRWYLVGEWKITRKDASELSKKARHSPDIVQGRMRTELNFNPLENPQNWSALASLPMSPAAGRWGKGDGVLSFNAAFEGDLFLDLTLWPEMEARQP